MKPVFKVLLATVASLLFAATASAESFGSLTGNGYSLAATGAVGNGNTWLYLKGTQDMYICLNMPGVNKIGDCKAAAPRGRVNYIELLESGAKIMSNSPVGNGNEWIMFVKGSETQTCLAMPGIYTIECR
jgi:hypothetical protein